MAKTFFQFYLQSLTACIVLLAFMTTARAEVYWKGTAVITEATPQCGTDMARLEVFGGRTLESTLRPAGLPGNGTDSFLTLGRGSLVRTYKFFQDDLRTSRVTQPAVFYVRPTGWMWGVVEFRTGGRIIPEGFDESTKHIRLTLTLHNVAGFTSCDITVKGTYLRVD